MLTQKLDKAAQAQTAKANAQSRKAVGGNLLVTGASTGIGRASTLRFASLGFKVYAGVRTLADAEGLKAEGLPQIEPILLDVTRPESIANALFVVGKEPLAGLINNAGIAVVGPLELVSIDKFHREFEVNVIGLIAVTQACLPLLRRGPGRIVNIGSIAGRSALPCSGAYDASKFAVEALTDALRMELHPSGISVSVVEPGAVATAIWDKSVAELDDLGRQAPPELYAHYRGLVENVRKEILKSGRSAANVGTVVKAVEHALTARRPRTRYPIGWDARLWLLLNFLPDRWRDRLILSQLSR